MKVSRFCLVGTVILALAACGSDEVKDEDVAVQPVGELYNNAMDELEADNLKSAATGFEEVEKQHPYSEWAKRAQIMNAYSQYRKQDYDAAIPILDRFVKLYPGDEKTPYAFYLIALCYYEQITDVGRDQAVTAQAMNALQDVVRRYPGSDYARDAQLKYDLTVDHLAGKEMEVGRYYLRHQEYAAAINRFQTVIKQYQTTSQVPEALERLVESYLQLGVVDEARRYGSVLGYNYPRSDWYRQAYALLEGRGVKPDSPAWWEKVF